MSAAAPGAAPRVSVVIPTFRRLDLLRRAVESVFAQTSRGWELVISDDEPEAGRTWSYLRRLSASDARVRVLRNPGPHGQTGNANAALRAARGAWVKPLFDDDTLRPECLERFLAAVEGRPDVALARCLAGHFEDDRLIRVDPVGRCAHLERIDSRRALLAIYLQDVELGTPTQVMARRELVEAGIWFEERAGLAIGVDAWWFIRLLARGDLLLLNEPLAERRQGPHPTVTRGASDDQLYSEFALLRELMRPMIDPALNPPPLPVVKKMLRLIRAARCAWLGRPGQAVALGSRVLDPRAWRLFARWGLRRSAPGRFELVARETLAPVARDAWAPTVRTKRIPAPHAAA